MSDRKEEGALMQRPGWLREDIMLQFDSAAFACASACACPPVVVALPAYDWSTAAVSCVRRIQVMSCLWLDETKCACRDAGERWWARHGRTASG